MLLLSNTSEKIAERLFLRTPCHAFMGMTLVALSAGMVHTSVRVPHAHTTSYKGSLQGGIIGMYADSPLWLATLTALELQAPGILGAVLRGHKPHLRTSSLIIEFKQVVMAGDILDIQARYMGVIPHTPNIIAKKRVYISSAEIINQHNNLVAIARAENSFVS